MKRRTIGLYLGAIMALSATGLLYAADPPAKPPAKAALTLAPIPSGSPVYSPTYFQPQTFNSASKTVEFTQSTKTAEISINGTNVTLAWNPPATFGLKVGNMTRALPVNPIIDGLNPASITLANKQQYVLAFPYASPT
ncbi:MAG: hypothetical protein FWD53_11510, partial [Phycisphaerales bacterium]|nr:hypothetical protein [Phycisphaerales bacterium]